MRGALAGGLKVACLVACAVAFACSGFACSGSTRSGNVFGDDGGGSSGGSGGSSSSGGGSSSGSFGDGGGSGSGSGGGNGCSGQAADFVYVLSAQNDLYSFAPAAKKFTKIGALGCNTAMQPNSMAVDRNAVAYVNYVQGNPATGQDSAGAIFQVSTQDASCSGPIMSLPASWYRLGMGYSSNNAGSTAETLYVAGTSGTPLGGSSPGLGLVDFGKKAIGPIGQFSGSLAGGNAELTGTGDGRLYGFFASTVQVAQINKTSGATQAPVTMTGVQPPNDWAFSFWGGHFYLYTSQGQGAGNGSNVTDYDPVSGSINPAYMTSIGFDIVGAGVSTCAPTTPPQ
ncbi:MAG TPA: hypothetical protein VIF15_04165 [Polyangiaceae bacterium]|jgi:hypothetical protein